MSKKTTKVMAFLALFWIIIWIVWTWILIIINWWWNSSTSDQSLTPEQFQELQDLIKSQWWTWALNNSWATTNSWSETLTSTWSETSTWKVE